MREFSRFFSHTFTVIGTGASLTSQPGPTWQPPIDIYECDAGIHIYVELPGVQKDQLDVSVEGGVLRIAGYRAKNVPGSVEHVHQMEIPFGHFARFVRLPESADVQQINARFEDAYLVIRIPRRAAR